MTYFSESLGGFIPAAWKDDGTYTEETWPADAVLLTDDEVARFWRQPVPAGKKLGSSEGRPVWVDIPQVPLSSEQTEAILTGVLNKHLDSVAGQRRYDSRFTCALRAGFPGPFQEEGQVFAAWMDACNMVGYRLMAEVKAGTRPVPTDAELIAALPVIEWPASPIPPGAA